MGVAIGFPLFRPRIVSSEKLPTFMPRRNKDEIMALLMRTKALTRYCFAIRYVLLFCLVLSREFFSYTISPLRHTSASSCFASDFYEKAYQKNGLVQRATFC